MGSTANVSIRRACLTLNATESIGPCSWTRSASSKASARLFTRTFRATKPWKCAWTFGRHSRYFWSSHKSQTTSSWSSAPSKTITIRWKQWTICMPPIWLRSGVIRQTLRTTWWCCSGSMTSWKRSVIMSGRCASNSKKSRWHWCATTSRRWRWDSRSKWNLTNSKTATMNSRSN